MTESGEYKTQTRVYGAGASYVTSTTSDGTWLIDADGNGMSFAAVCDAVIAFAADYPDKRVLQVRIIHTFDGSYIGVVDTEG